MYSDVNSTLIPIYNGHSIYHEHLIPSDIQSLEKQRSLKAEGNEKSSLRLFEARLNIGWAQNRRPMPLVLHET